MEKSLETTQALELVLQPVEIDLSPLAIRRILEDKLECAKDCTWDISVQVIQGDILIRRRQILALEAIQKAHDLFMEDYINHLDNTINQ